jgi:hypothetical protein
METTNIYVLIDPRDGKVRYVGKANNISQRYQAHLNRARDHQTHKRNWINELKKLKLKPILSIIDEVPIHEWVYWEEYWITQMKAWGFNLTNHTNGGDGCTFGNQTSFKKGQGGKKVVGYNSNYEKVYEFETAEDATKYLKTHRSSIPRCASGKSKTIKNIAWFYYSKIDKINYDSLKQLINSRFTKEIKSNSGSFYKGQKSVRAKRIEVENIETNEKEIFESGEYFGRVIGVSQTTISWAIKNNKIIKKIFKIKIYEQQKTVS